LKNEVEIRMDSIQITKNYNIEMQITEKGNSPDDVTSDQNTDKDLNINRKNVTVEAMNRSKILSFYQNRFARVYPV